MRLLLNVLNMLNLSNMLIVLASSSLACLAPVSQAATPDALIHTAQDLADHLADTQYQHKGLGGQPDVSQGTDGRYRAYTDCSGFVTWALDRVAPAAMTPITDEMRRARERHKWPQAYVFQRYFAKLGSGHDQYWQGIIDLRQLAAGDVVSWCADQYCAGAQQDGAKADNTGHIMVVRAVPQLVQGDAYARLLETLDKKQSSLPPATKAVYSLPVVDSSATKHYDDATRGKTEGSSGVGTGSIYFAVDEQGAPIGMQFPGGAFRFTGSAGKDGEHTVGFGMGRLLAQ